MYFDFLGEMPLFLPKEKDLALNGKNESVYVWEHKYAKKYFNGFVAKY